MRPLAISILIFAGGIGACVAPADVEYRPCPCGQGRKCCASVGFCYLEGQTCPPALACNDADAQDHIIDDMERGTDRLSSYTSGAWYAANDGTPGAHQGTPDGMAVAAARIPEGERCGSQYAIHTTGAGFQNWGAEVALNFHLLLESDGGAEPASIDDAERMHYPGVRFWARAAPGTNPDLFVGFPDRSTQPEGGLCSPDPDAGNTCYDFFGQSVALSAQWTEYFLYFHDLYQGGWGNLAQRVDTGALYGIVFAFRDRPAPFDLWIDDVAWIGQAGPGHDAGAPDSSR